MLRRSILVATVVAAVLLAASAALAKGPTGATIEGEGVTGTLDIDEPGELGQGTPMSDLVAAAGFFPLVFGDDTVTSEPPTTALGRPLLITWRMGDDEVVEEIYLHASGGPVAHVAPGQLFWDDTHASGGGWLRVTEGIAAPLIDLGVDEAALSHLRPDRAAEGAPAPATTPAPPPGATLTPVPLQDGTVRTTTTPAPSPPTASRSVALGLAAAAALGGAIGVAAWRNRRRPRMH